MNPKILNLKCRQVIGCAIRVHRTLGPGLLESVYQEAMEVELAQDNLPFERNKPVPIVYRNVTLATPLRLDLLVVDEIIVELKAVETIHPVFEAQLLTYMRLARKSIGLLINFNVPLLTDGIRRKVRSFTDPIP